MFCKYFSPPRENKKTYTCIKDTHAAIIQGGISSPLGKHVMSPYATVHNGTFISDEVETRLRKTQKSSSMRKRKRMLLLKYFFLLSSVKKSILVMMNQKRKLQ